MSDRHPRDLLDLLIAHLLAIYTSAGQEVTYQDKQGKVRPYWPNRYLQAVRRAIAEDEVVEFVERIVTRDGATRGFGYLQDANRLDLTVEALVADDTQPYHSLFSPEAVEQARSRLVAARDYIDRAVEFRVELLRTVRSVDGTATHLEPGRYDVKLMRHWPARLSDEVFRAGDIWFLLDGPEGSGVWVRAAECKALT